MYPHRVRVYSEAEGATDPDTGIYTPGEITVHYEGPADVQDEGAFVSFRAETSEAVRGRSEATVFVPERADISSVRPEHIVAVDWDGQEPTGDPDDWWKGKDSARVVKRVRLDSKIFVEGIAS